MNPEPRPNSPRNPLIGALDDEWAGLSTSEATRRTFARWERTHRALDGISSCDDDAITYLRRAGDGALHALLQIAQSTDRDSQLAARILLQVMLPAVCGLLAGNRGRRVRDAGEAIDALWTTIRTYPLHRRRKVTANLYMEMIGILAASARKITEVPIHEHAAPLPAPNASAELLDLLMWAVQLDVLDRPTAQLLLDRYSPADPDHVMVKNSTETVAAQRQLSAVALRKRCSKAVAALSVAVQQYGYTPPAELLR